MNLSFEKLTTILSLVSQAGLISVGGDKLTLALTVLQLVKGGDLSLASIAEFVEKNGVVEGEDAKKIALAVQILKILAEDAK